METSNHIGKIRTYFSHSYRPEDRELNIFFWNLFCDKEFFFSVDPKSAFLSTAHLEIMMNGCNCFVAIVTFREEEEYTRCSPYILYENRMAVQSKKPRLILKENNVPGHYLGGDSNEIIPFDRDVLEPYTDEYLSRIDRLAEKAWANRTIYSQLSREVGIILETTHGTEAVYDNSIIEAVREIVDKLGYRLNIIDASNMNSFEFCNEIDNCGLIILEQRQSLLPDWISSYIMGKFKPSIKVCHYKKDEDPATLDLSPLVWSFWPKLPDEHEKMIGFWNDSDELCLGIYNNLKKIEQKRLILNNKSLGLKYLKSIGRKPVKVFISNPSSLNSLAEKLAERLDSENINHFHYREDQAIPLGTKWENELKKQLNECGLFIALINRDFMNKKWCHFELDIAKQQSNQKKMSIVPYFLETTVPTVLQDFQGKELAGKNDDEIVSTIAKDIDRLLQPSTEEK